MTFITPPSLRHQLKHKSGGLSNERFKLMSDRHDYNVVVFHLSRAGKEKRGRLRREDN
jgi:hypothetical protein